MQTGNRTPRIGVIGVHDGWSSQKLAEAVAKRCGAGPLIELTTVKLDLERGIARNAEFDLLDFDALIVKKLGHSYAPELLDRLEILHYVHERGVPVFSRPRTLMRLIDRLACTVNLRLADVPMPPTFITESIDDAVEAARAMGRVVLKPLYTSKARGMELVDGDSPDLRERLAEFQAHGNPVLYLQKFFSIARHDLGVVFLGGEYLACYSRVRQGDSWSTSTSRGGRYQPYNPPPEVIEIARRAQSVFDLAFTCVDVLETNDGPLVFEVSAFGGFRGLLEANGIAAAERYVDWVIGKLAHGE